MSCRTTANDPNMVIFGGRKGKGITKHKQQLKIKSFMCNNEQMHVGNCVQNFVLIAVMFSEQQWSWS